MSRSVNTFLGRNRPRPTSGTLTKNGSEENPKGRSAPEQAIVSSIRFAGITDLHPIPDVPTMDMSRGTGFDIDEHASTGIRLVGVGTDREQFQIRPPSAWLDKPLVIETGPNLNRLILWDSSDRRSLPLTVIARAGQRIQLVTRNTFGDLYFSGGNWDLSQFRPGDVFRLVIRDTMLEGSTPWDVTEVFLSGELTMNLELKAQRSLVTSDVSLGGGPWKLGALAGSHRVSVRARSEVVVGAIGGSATFALGKESSLRFLRDDDAKPEQVVISGPGFVEIQSGRQINEIEFVLDTAPTQVRLGSNAAVEKARGVIGLSGAEPRARVRGDSSSGVGLANATELQGCELLNVDVAGLPLVEVDNLASASVVHPWIPAGRSRAQQVQVFEGSWSVPADDSQRDFRGSKDDLARIAERWRKLELVLRDKQVYGSTASRLRYAATSWRRKVLSWKWGQIREKFWLTLFWLFGYGERALRPLLVFVFSALILTPFLAPQEFQIDQPDTWWGHGRSSLAKLLLAPLSTLRLVVVDSSGGPEAWPILIARAVGVLCIGFAGLSVTRLARRDSRA